MVDEEIDVDPVEANKVFQRSLKYGKFSYLDLLQKHALNDYGLEGEETVILRVNDEKVHIC